MQELATGEAMITSQNPGLAVDEDSPPQTLKASKHGLSDQKKEVYVQF